MLFQTTPAHEELRAKIRAFAEEEIKPLAFLLDQNNEFPDEPVKKMAQLGWLGLPFPKEYGGAGLDILSYAIAVEELARVDGGAGVILSAHVSLGAWPIFAYGTEEQKQKYLVPLAKGEKLGAFGLTEPNAGSDAGGTETTALDKGDHYLLEADLPGFQKEDIDLHVQDGVLTITAKHDETRENKDESGKYVCRERRTGSFSRSFTLAGVQEDAIRASYQDGVLELILPKRQEVLPQCHKIQIQ